MTIGINLIPSYDGSQWECFQQGQAVVESFQVCSQRQDGVCIVNDAEMNPKIFMSYFSQGTLKGEVSLYSWPPVW